MLILNFNFQFSESTFEEKNDYFLYYRLIFVEALSQNAVVIATKKVYLSSFGFRTSPIPGESKKVYMFNEPQHHLHCLDLKDSTWIRQMRLQIKL